MKGGSILVSAQEVGVGVRFRGRTHVSVVIVERDFLEER